MRELKFRLWSKRTNRYIKTCIVDGVAYNEISAFDLFGLRSSDAQFQSEIIIEQYTGLKDKNGREIYDGDILRLTRKVASDKSTLYQVIWDEYIVAFNTKNLDKKRWDIGYLNETAAKKDYEVIGNIHENPELLGGE